ncbi:hypothetical protein N7537_010307 [Penicillium hordei]|uniref:BZIP domain-containing protein n=1 Tax=Penicillium hordei TaxID=40994 RepID=A0AAD6DUE4_9EURO|nr:uncharacterized protein N7537_010307 [Penicillium hordei]KAJ5593403.1 hypothetical protein N7537_010307 [Penicillium hordei]
MDVNVQFMSDTAERRRTQNRLAQRKFREKRKRRVAENAVETPQDSSQSTSTANNNGNFPINSLPSFTSAIPALAGALPPDEIPIASTGSGPVDNFDLDAIDQFLYQTNHDFAFTLSDSLPVQSSATRSNFTQSNSSGPGSRKAPHNSTTSDNSASLSQSGDSHSLPLHHITSASDIRPESPPLQPPQSPNYDTVLELITSARNDKGWIGPLHIAAQKGHERIVRVLLLQDNIDANNKDSDGRTPLIHAVIENHDSVVRLLLSHGARIGVYDCDGRSALHWAVLHRRLEILKQLLGHRAKYEPGLDIDVYDNYGWTPLHMSVDRAFEAGILMLLQEGADINAKAHKCPYTGTILPLMDG